MEARIWTHPVNQARASVRTVLSNLGGFSAAGAQAAAVHMDILLNASRSRCQSSGAASPARYRGDRVLIADYVSSKKRVADAQVLGVCFIKARKRIAPVSRSRRKPIPSSMSDVNLGFEAERDHGADTEDQDEYLAHNIFWVPPKACGQLSRLRHSSPPAANWRTTPWLVSSAPKRQLPKEKIDDNEAN